MKLVALYSSIVLLCMLNEYLRTDYDSSVQTLTDTSSISYDSQMTALNSWAPITTLSCNFYDWLSYKEPLPPHHLPADGECLCLPLLCPMVTITMLTLNQPKLPG